MQTLVDKYELSLFATSTTPKGKQFIYIDQFGINVVFNEWDKSFELTWIVPNTIFQLTCPNCSPYDYPGHFDRMYKKFVNIVADFKWSLEEGV